MCGCSMNHQEVLFIFVQIYGENCLFCPEMDILYIFRDRHDYSRNIGVIPGNRKGCGPVCGWV
ncbi:hypothetical protein C3B58_20800 [Lactonifactor longoviformis]|nr:hypothetical protein C3B58_20800 [Lactonifactor longoviformis]